MLAERRRDYTSKRDAAGFAPLPSGFVPLPAGFVPLPAGFVPLH